MNLNDWRKKNRPYFGSEYETQFVDTVLPLVKGLNLDALSAQYPFRDRDGRQRYCDFVIHENDNVRIAIEIDGYDKRRTGEGMSHVDFVDWQRRQAALTSLGWYVLRFANRDVREEPKRCAEHISLLLKYLRGKSQPNELSVEEKAQLDGLTKAQKDTIKQLKLEKSSMKYAIASFTTIILILVMVIVWQSNDLSHRQPSASLQSAAIPQELKTPVVSGGVLSKNPPATAQNPATQTQSDALVKIHKQYNHVLTSKGITCETNELAGYDGIPTLDKQGHFSCRCTTDMMCMLMNPHMHEYSGEIYPEVIANAPKGTKCENPISWEDARQNIGKTFVVVGPLIKVTQPENVRGNPTWIDIGATFPNSHRLTLIIWGNKMAEFPFLKKGQMDGKKVCVVGRIDSYKGIPQIELRHEGQFMVEQ